MRETGDGYLIKLHIIKLLLNVTFFFSMGRMVIYAVKAKNIYRFGYRFGGKTFEIRNVDCDTGLFRVISIER